MNRRPSSHRILICLGRSVAGSDRFPALVHRASEGGYWAEVPAIPGCATQAESLPQLRQNLCEAISGCMDIRDHHTVLEIRAKNAGTRTYSSAEVRARLGLASKK